MYNMCIIINWGMYLQAQTTYFHCIEYNTTMFYVLKLAMLIPSNNLHI